MSEPDDPAAIERMKQGFVDLVPHNLALGMQLQDFGRDGQAWLRLPYAQKLVGNPATGVLHGGAITSLLDACCGAAVFFAMMPPRPIATLDLRIDYLRPATPGMDVVAHGQTIKVTRHVAFVRATAYHDDPDDPIAVATGSFMLFGKSRSGKPGSGQGGAP